MIPFLVLKPNLDNLVVVVSFYSYTVVMSGMLDRHKLSLRVTRFSQYLSTTSWPLSINKLKCAAHRLFAKPGSDSPSFSDCWWLAGLLAVCHWRPTAAHYDITGLFSQYLWQRPQVTWQFSAILLVKRPKYYFKCQKITLGVLLKNEVKNIKKCNLY